MKAQSILLALLVGLLFPMQIAAAKEITINAGTRVPVSVYNTVSSNNLNEGDMVAVGVANDVKIDGVTVFKKGAQGVVFVSKAVRGRGHGGKGILEINGGRIYDALIMSMPLTSLPIVKGLASVAGL